MVVLSDVGFFREKLAKFKRQVRMTKRIPANRAIGIFNVDTSVFKNTLAPSPKRCLECVYAIVPTIARQEVDRLTKETQDAEYTLALPMQGAVDFVNHLTFLRSIQLRVSNH